MQTSESIGQIAAALAAAQAVMGGALKDSANPFFKSKYADLESVWGAARAALTSNGLAIVQGTDGLPDNQIGVTTRLIHTSGEWISSTIWMTPKDMTPQSVGSTITYARRYGLAAMVGIYQTDDDAEAAQGRPSAVSEKMYGYPANEASALTALTRIRADMKSGDSVRLREYHAEIKANEQLFTSVWKSLSTDEKTKFKEILNGK